MLLKAKVVMGEEGKEHKKSVIGLTCVNISQKSCYCL